MGDPASAIVDGPGSGRTYGFSIAAGPGSSQGGRNQIEPHPGWGGGQAETGLRRTSVPMTDTRPSPSQGAWNEGQADLLSRLT
jgi:hypothetical protein